MINRTLYKICSLRNCEFTSRYIRNIQLHIRGFCLKFLVLLKVDNILQSVFVLSFIILKGVWCKCYQKGYAVQSQRKGHDLESVSKGLKTVH